MKRRRLAFMPINTSKCAEPHQRTAFLSDRMRSGGLAIIAMHHSISKIMDLHFEIHMRLALIFLVILRGIGRMRRGER